MWNLLSFFLYLITFNYILIISGRFPWSIYLYPIKTCLPQYLPYGTGIYVSIPTICSTYAYRQVPWLFFYYFRFIHQSPCVVELLLHRYHADRPTDFALSMLIKNICIGDREMYPAALKESEQQRVSCRARVDRVGVYSKKGWNPITLWDIILVVYRI